MEKELFEYFVYLNILLIILTRAWDFYIMRKYFQYTQPQSSRWMAYGFAFSKSLPYNLVSVWMRKRHKDQRLEQLRKTHNYLILASISFIVLPLFLGAVLEVSGVDV